MNTKAHSWLLGGLDGGHPLAFLAAIGTLRTAARAWPEQTPTMGWEQTAGGWRPNMAVPGLDSREELLKGLESQLSTMVDHSAFAFADDLTLSPEEYRRVSEAAGAEAIRGDRVWADFISAFGSEIRDPSRREEIRMHATSFRLLGSGQTTFMQPLREIVSDTKISHVEDDLFHPWKYSDPLEKHSMRWDPQDDSRYALQWRDPSGDPIRKKTGSVWGANRLAIEGLPLFPVQPTGKRALTTGFTSQQRKGLFLSWPIWKGAASLDVVRSLLSLRELQEETPQRMALGCRGVEEIFRCQRVMNGKYKNFAPAVPA
jgi:hypothetical protein